MKICLTKSIYKLNSGGDSGPLWRTQQLLERFVLRYQWLSYINRSSFSSGGNRSRIDVQIHNLVM